MSKKRPPQLSPWRLFVSRTAMMVGVLALGVLLYTQKQENASPQPDPEAKTYAVMKVPVEDAPGESEMPETASRQSAWQSTSDGYVNAAHPGSYDDSFNDITINPVGQDSAGQDNAAQDAPESDLPADTPTNDSSGYSPKPKAAEPVPKAPAPAPVPQTVPIPPLSPFPVFSGSNTPPAASQPDAVPQSQVDVQPPAAGYRVGNFLDIFNFDITPDWVTSRWKHVASVGPVHTRGYRVPLVTGTDKSDLVGNLTYYFDAHLEVEKITFEGFTGDLDRLVITLRHFNMAKRLTSDPNMLIYETPTPTKQRSYLKTYHRTALEDENHPYRKFWLTLELYPPEDD